jgi:hypothetical protein
MADQNMSFIIAPGTTFYKPPEPIMPKNNTIRLYDTTANRAFICARPYIRIDICNLLIFQKKVLTNPFFWVFNHTEISLNRHLTGHAGINNLPAPTKGAMPQSPTADAATMSMFALNN